MVSVEERVAPKIARFGSNGCWLWTGVRNNHGYGQISVQFDDRWPNVRMAYAHRVVYELEVGPIPEGLVLDHLCRTPACVNPSHLEPVTQAENLRRTRRSHCKRGHEFTAENAYVRRDNGHRMCRKCQALRKGRAPVER